MLADTMHCLVHYWDTVEVILVNSFLYCAWDQDICGSQFANEIHHHFDEYTSRAREMKIRMCRCVPTPTLKQLMHGSFVYYRIYPYSLPVSSLKIAHEAFGLVRYFYWLNRKLVRINPIIHSEPFINYYLSSYRTRDDL